MAWVELSWMVAMAVGAKRLRLSSLRHSARARVANPDPGPVERQLALAELRYPLVERQMVWRSCDSPDGSKEGDPLEDVLQVVNPNTAEQLVLGRSHCDILRYLLTLFTYIASA
eukprot:scaffold10796_cov102-Skeletonema_dohrnii-CCMP3373.AAC.2